MECELACREYTTGMPGAHQAHLLAGDFMVYRNSLWHIGNYVHYRKRATLHHALFTPEYRQFVINAPFHPHDAEGKPAGWENPNHTRRLAAEPVMAR